MNPKRQYQEKEEKHDNNKCLKILNGRVEMGLVMAMKKAIEFKGNFILTPLSFSPFDHCPSRSFAGR